MPKSDEALRKFCAEYKQRLSDNPDAATDDMQRGFHEAWRVYEARPAVRTTAQGGIATSSTQGLIRRHLQQLVDHGCFVATGQEPHERFRPTLRYQILVKQLASMKLYRQVQALLDAAPHESLVPHSQGDGHA